MPTLSACLRWLAKRRRLDPIMSRHALRTALASVLTLLLVEAFSLPQGYWAVISAILVMQSNLGRSLHSGWSRIQGTFVGAVLGVLSLMVLGNSFIALGVGVFCTIFFCAYLIGLHESFRIAALTASIVILMGRNVEAPLLLGVERFVEISLGVGVAMGVSWFVLPFRARQSVRMGLRASMESAAAFLSRLMAQCFGQTAPPALTSAKRDCIRQVMRLGPGLEDAAREPGGLGERGQALRALTNAMERLMEDLLAMEHAARELAEETLHLRMQAELASLTTAVEQGLLHAASHVQDREVTTSDMRPTMQALERALYDVERTLEQLRARRIPQKHGLGEVSHFFSLVFCLKEATLELMDILGSLHEGPA